jgi:hypothetical protein
MDHLPLTLDCENLPKQNSRTTIRKYEVMSERNASLSAVIDEAWLHRTNCSSLAELLQKIERTREHLKVWKMQVFGKVTESIKNRRKTLNKLWNKPQITTTGRGSPEN